MKSKETQFYKITTDSERLSFKTAYYRAEKMSVLHSGVYNKEFTSMLFSGAIGLVSYMLTEFMDHKTVLRYFIVFLVFLISFLGARGLIFKEHYLEAVFDKASGILTLTYPGLFPKKEHIPFNTISSVELGSKKYIPRNIDAINFVQKISIQHGSAVPGLGQEEEYITVYLKLKNNSQRIIFACRTDTEPEPPLNEIRHFLGNTV